LGEQDQEYRRSEAPLSCSRRAFFPALLREATVTLGMLRGGQGGRLSELGNLPEQKLALLKPIVNPAYEILVEEDSVWGRYKSTGATIKLFDLEERESLLAFNMFDGKHNLGQIGRQLAQEMGWPEAAGFVYAKDLFIFAAGYLICVPKDPPLSLDTDLDGSEGQGSI
jgi:hypothetical protein